MNGKSFIKMIKLYGKNNPHWKGGNQRFPLCLYCNKKLSRLDAKFCRTCLPKYQIGKNSGNYKNGATLKKYYCNCGALLKSPLSKHCRTGANKIHSKKMKGKNNPAYIGSKIISQYPYNWNSLKKEIYKRDKYTCQLCRKPGYAVHHIDYNKNNCKENNLINLCHSCHCKTNYNRRYWKNNILSLIRRNHGRLS